MRAAVGTGPRTIPRAGDLLRGAGGALRGALRAPSTAVRRRLLALALVAIVLAGTYYFWFRDSSLVRVQKVTVSGLSGTDAPRHRAALIAAAHRMTTLHVDVDALRRAMGAGATIDALRVTTDFPHGLRIEVVEKAPVAVLVSASDRVAVGAGGVLLPAVHPIPGWLPVIDVGALPAHGRLGQGRASRLVEAAAAAPGPLRPRITSLRELPGKGLVAYIRNGPEVILGSPIDLTQKWAAAAAILADPTSRGASYVDVRLPDRPVAGGLVLKPPPPDTSGAAPPTAAASTGSSGAQTSTSPPPPAAAGASSPAYSTQPTPTPSPQTVPPSGTTQATPVGTGGPAPHGGP